MIRRPPPILRLILAGTLSLVIWLLIGAAALL